MAEAVLPRIFSMFAPRRKYERDESQANTAPRDEVSTFVSTLYDKSQLRPYNPDALYQKHSNYDLFDEMRQDDQVSSLLKLKKYFILSPEISFESDSQEAKEFLEKMFKETTASNIKKIMWDILTAIDYGFSISEKIWGRDEAGMVACKNIKTRAPHGFEIHTDEFGNITDIRQWQERGYVSLPKDKFIVYTYQKEFDNHYGQSDLNEGVYRSYWSKSAIIRFWNIFLERFGMPLAIGKYPVGKEGMSDKLKKILQNLQAKTAITMSNELSIEFLEAVRAGTAGYENAIDKHNLSIARAMLIPDLLGFSGGQTGGGSYSLGEKQFDLFYSVIDTQRQDIAAVINREIIRPLMDWNFGKNVKAELKFVQINQAKKNEDMKLWLEVVKIKPEAGSIENVNKFLDSIGMQKIADVPVATVIPTVTPDATQPTAPETEQPENEEMPETDTPVKPYAYRRPLNKYEIKAGVSAIHDKIEKVEEKYKKALSEQFKGIINGLVEYIRDKKIVELGKMDLVNGLQLKNTAPVEKALKEMLVDANNIGITSVRNGKLKTLAVISNKREDMSDVQDMLRQFIKTKSKMVLKIEGQNILKKAEVTLINAIQKGDSLRDVEKQLEKDLAEYDLTGSRIETIVRTNIMESFNSARAEQFKQIEGDIQAYQYSSVIDDRTTDLCLELDEKFFPPADLDKFSGFRHFNCRGLVVPVFTDEEFDGEFNMPEVTTDNYGQMVLA